MSDVKLIINNTLYEGWLNVNIRRSIEQLSGTFVLNITDRWSTDSEPLFIRSNDECVLVINNIPIITGYVDRVYISLDSNAHSITISGRDKTADIIDCSAISETGQFLKQTLGKIATELCKPFGIKVIVNAETGDVFKTFNIEQGASVYDTLQKLCNARGVLATSDGLGNLLITKPGNFQVANPIVEGVNLLSGTAEYDNSYRFSDYICKGQVQGSDSLDIDSIISNVAKIKDDEINRYRPLLIVYDGQATKANCETRAIWEKNTRRGRSKRYTIKVASWTQPLQNILWNLNQLVTLNSKKLDVFDTLLIASITFDLGEGGEITTLELTSPDAYLKQDIPEAQNPFSE